MGDCVYFLREEDIDSQRAYLDQSLKGDRMLQTLGLPIEPKRTIVVNLHIYHCRQVGHTLTPRP